MDAFLKLISTMDDLIAEFQIDSNGLIEKNYKYAANPITGEIDLRLRLFLGLLTETVPESIDYLQYPIETLSYHPADALTYAHPTVVVVYEADVPNALLEAFGVPEGNYVRGGFAIKWDLVTKEKTLKLADLDYSKYIKPKFPLFTKIGTSFGVGVHFSPTRKNLTSYSDFYVASPFGCRGFWQRKYGDLYPTYEEDFTPLWRAYSVQTDEYGDVVKLKRYIYWNDKSLIGLMRA